jgi:hypothetical protein
MVSHMPAAEFFELRPADNQLSIGPAVDLDDLDEVGQLGQMIKYFGDLLFMLRDHHFGP